MTAASAAFLRRSLVLDAVATGATALLLVAGAGLLTDFTGLPAALLRGAGLILIPFVGLLVLTAVNRAPAPAHVWVIIGGNALWVAASIVLLMGGWATPSALGYAFVLAQALVVGVFAELQYIGLRQLRAA